MHPVFIKFTLIFFLLPFSCSTCSAVPCFFCSICSTFLFFTIFSTIATVSAAISSPFAQSFCPFAAYKLVLFHFYFIQEKETPSLFRSSVSDICSSSVLSQFRKMMQNSVIPCFVIFRYFLLSEGHIHNLLHLLNLLSVNHADDCVHAPLCDFRYILTNRCQLRCQKAGKIQAVVADHLQFFRNLNPFFCSIFMSAAAVTSAVKSPSIPSKWLMYFSRSSGRSENSESCFRHQSL